MHDKNGKKIELFDKLMAPTGSRWENGKHTPVMAEARVIAIDPGNTTCQLTILVGEGKVLGTVNHNVSCAEYDKGQKPFQAVMLSGYHTSANAADCELVPKPE